MKKNFPLFLLFKLFALLKNLPFLVSLSFSKKKKVFGEKICGSLINSPP